MKQVIVYDYVEHPDGESVNYECLVCGYVESNYDMWTHLSFVHGLLGNFKHRVVR